MFSIFYHCFIQKIQTSKSEDNAHGNGIRVGSWQTWGISIPFLYEMQKNIATLATLGIHLRSNFKK